MKDVAHYKYISEIRGSGANQDPTDIYFHLNSKHQKYTWHFLTITE